MVNLKVIVVGEDACGKTSLVRALRRARYDGIYRQTTTHVGHTFTVQINGEIVTIEIWDISRREDFRASTDIDAILGCFSIGDRRNYLRVTDIINDAQDYILARQLMFDAHLIPVILIGTKSDMRDTLSRPRRYSGQASPSRNVQETSFTTGGAEAGTSSRNKTKASASQGFEAEPSASASSEKSSLLPAVETLAPVSVSGPAPVDFVVQTPVAAAEGRALAKVMDAEGYYECSALTGDGVMELRRVLGSHGIEREFSCRRCCSRCVLYCLYRCKCRRNQ